MNNQELLGALAAAIVGGHAWHQVTESLTEVLTDEVAAMLPELKTCWAVRLN